LSGVGPAPGMSGNDEIVPALNERTRQLIVSLVETGIESALATRGTSLAGNDAAVAARNPSPTSASAAPAAIPRRSGRVPVPRIWAEDRVAPGLSKIPRGPQKTKTRLKAPEMKTKMKKTARMKTNSSDAPRNQRRVVRDASRSTHPSALRHSQALRP
jgi:hypothetical protein